MDGKLDISDAVRTLEALFLTGDVLPCSAAGDSNADGNLDISDPISTIGFLFLGGQDPVPPFPGCGPESLPAGQALGCATAPGGCR